MKKTHYIGIVLLCAAAIAGAGVFIMLPRASRHGVVAEYEVPALEDGAASITTSAEEMSTDSAGEKKKATLIALAETRSAPLPVSEAVRVSASQTFPSIEAVQSVIAEPNTVSKKPAGQSAPLVSPDENAESPAALKVSENLPYSTREFSGWQGTWGRVEVTPSGSLSLKATAETAGAEALLPHSGDWSDYNYMVNVTVSNGDITLFARYADADNFVACNFWRNEVAILERSDGKTAVVAKTLIPGVPSDPYFAKNTSVSMRVKDATVGCTALGGDGDNLVSTIDGLPRRGGIGIQTWFHAPGAATLELREVRVEAL